MAQLIARGKVFGELLTRQWNQFNEYHDPNENDYNGVIQQRAYNGRIVHLPWNHETPISLPKAGNFNMDRL